MKKKAFVMLILEITPSFHWKNGLINNKNNSDKKHRYLRQDKIKSTIFQFCFNLLKSTRKLSKQEITFSPNGRIDKEQTSHPMNLDTFAPHRYFWTKLCNHLRNLDLRKMYKQLEKD